MNSRPLETLTELAREARNKAGQLLASERDNQRQLNEQLELLNRYRSEYAEQLEIRMDQGISLASLQDYQNFLASLDHAIDRARESLEAQRRTVGRYQEQWQQRQRSLSSYDTLASRRAADQLTREARAEMRLQDETSTNVYVRKCQQAES